MAYSVGQSQYLPNSEKLSGPNENPEVDVELKIKIPERSICSDIEKNKMFGVEDTNSNLITSSGELCRGECKTEQSCNYWSWESGVNRCHLFTSKSSTDKSDVISGEKHCKGIRGI